MISRTRSLFAAAILMIAFLHCRKEHPLPIVHCTNLVNDMPAWDQGAAYAVTAFTPNGDGLNDAFMVILKNIASVSIKVYDRNSTLVFQTTTPGATWIPNLTRQYEPYFYRIEAITQDNNRIGKCGEVYALSCYPGNKNRDNFDFQDEFDPNTETFSLPTAETLINCN